jgi:hypothetical protein
MSIEYYDFFYDIHIFTTTTIISTSIFKNNKNKTILFFPVSKEEL